MPRNDNFKKEESENSQEMGRRPTILAVLGDLTTPCRIGACSLITRMMPPPSGKRLEGTRQADVWSQGARGNGPRDMITKEWGLRQKPGGRKTPEQVKE